MEETKDLRKHMDDFNKIILDLKNVDVRIEEEDQAIILLSSLPKIYEHIVDTMLYGKQTLTMTEVKSVLMSKEIQRKSKLKEEKNGDSLLVRGRSEQRNGKSSYGKSWSKSRTSKKCFHCHKEGHFKRDCPDRKKWQDEKNGEHEKATVVSDSEGYESSDVLVVSTRSSEMEWILDSGCSFHMSPHKEWFHNFKKCEGGMVLLGDNKACKIMGIGSVVIKMFDGCYRTLKDVRYVPDLKRNLIFVDVLDVEGCVVKIDNGVIKINKGALTVMKGMIKNGLYALKGNTVEGTIDHVVAGEIDNTKLWHLRLGHISCRGMEELGKQNLLCGDQTSRLEFCESCTLEKSCRVKFNIAIHNTKGILNYVHSDLWGPSKVCSKGGVRYFISIIDDYSRRVWVYCLKSKDQAFEAFKDWKNVIENQVGRRIKKLRTDNDLEFCSNLFEKYCKNEGIARHKTVVNTPQ